jgi:hypothetical protein
MYPAGRHSTCRVKIPEADGGGRAAPDPRVCGLRSGVGEGLEPEGGHLVLFVADAQREMMQGATKDCVGAMVERLKGQYVAVPPHKHRPCAGQFIGQLQRRPAAVLCLVEGCFAALSVLENCSRKSFKGNSWESKSCPG